MARLPRSFVTGYPNHLIVRGNDRQDIFRSDGDRIHFHRNLTEIAQRSGVLVHAYVMMTNHVHLLATGSEPASIPALFQRLGRRYVSYFNHMHDRTGTLWEGRYKSCLVETDRYLLTCQRYIELNPVRAGIVRHPGAFRWSSYGRCANDKSDSLVTPHSIHESLGSRESLRLSAYREMFEQDIDADTLQRIRETVQKGVVLGSDAFCERLKAEGHRPRLALPMGRPRKEKPKIGNDLPPWEPPEDPDESPF